MGFEGWTGLEGKFKGLEGGGDGLWFRVPAVGVTARLS